MYITVIFVQVHLQYDKLYVDGKCFVWNDHRGKVTSHDDFLAGKSIMMTRIIIIYVFDDFMKR